MFSKPKTRTTAAFNNFMGKLVVIVPHAVTKSQFPRTNKDGSSYYPDQTVAHVVPVEDAVGTNNQGKSFSHPAGQPVLSYISVKARNQLGEFGEPILGRVVKGQARNGAGAPTVLGEPTDEDVALAERVLKDFDPSALDAPTIRQDSPETQAATEDVTPERSESKAPWQR